MTDTTAKKDVQKLQRAIVDGLEDVKAQDIVVFNTEHLSALFERVVVASGTSNRQTKALAASVRDKVRDAGFPKPRVEGEENGEWIIIDCGQAVVHVMQPAIRQYYHLEEIWGDKPVRLKLGAPKPVSAAVTTRASSAKPSAGEKKPARAKTQSSSARAPQAAGKVPAKSATRAAGGAASAPSRKAKPATASAKPAARQPAAKKSAASPRTRTTPKA